MDGNSYYCCFSSGSIVSASLRSASLRPRCARACCVTYIRPHSHPFQPRFTCSLRFRSPKLALCSLFTAFTVSSIPFSFTLPACVFYQATFVRLYCGRCRTVYGALVSWQGRILCSPLMRLLLLSPQTPCGRTWGQVASFCLTDKNSTTSQ